MKLTLVVACALIELGWGCFYSGDGEARALMEELNPIGAACVIEAVHTCMTIRGAKKHGSTMVTSALRGIFKENPASRAEPTSVSAWDTRVCAPRSSRSDWLAIEPLPSDARNDEVPDHGHGALGCIDEHGVPTPRKALEPDQMRRQRRGDIRLALDRRHGVFLPA